jgi:hypothetical protein
VTWHNVAPMEPRYHRLAVLERAGSNRHGKALYRCQCDCGSPPFRVVGESLRTEKTRSCGCYRNERVRAGVKKRMGKGAVVA